MTAPRRQRRDSIQRMVSAALVPPPPIIPRGSTLTDDESVAYRHYFARREANEWSGAELLSLVRLAKLDCLIQRIETELIEAPLTITTTGGQTQNPLIKSLATLNAARLALVRSLHLHVIPGKHSAVNIAAHVDREIAPAFAGKVDWIAEAQRLKK